MVARGYDVVVGTYLKRFGRSTVRQRMIEKMIARSPAAARVLDLGCGAGVPLSSELIEHGFSVVGIDCSAQQIEMARRNVPKAEFVHADMNAVTFAPRSSHAVAAHMYLEKITHPVRSGRHRAWSRRTAATCHKRLFGCVVPRVGIHRFL